MFPFTHSFEPSWLPNIGQCSFVHLSNIMWLIHKIKKINAVLYVLFSRISLKWTEGLPLLTPTERTSLNISQLSVVPFEKTQCWFRVFQHLVCWPTATQVLSDLWWEQCCILVLCKQLHWEDCPCISAHVVWTKKSILFHWTKITNTKAAILTKVTFTILCIMLCINTENMVKRSLRFIHLNKYICWPRYFLTISPQL